MENTNGSSPAWVQKAEFNRFGIISAMLMIVGILGGLAVGMGGVNHTWILILVVVSTMTCLSLILALGPMKYIIYTGVINVVLDIIFLSYFLIT